MSNEQRELFAFKKSLHSVHVYLLLICWLPQCQRNGMRLGSKIYLSLTDFFRLTCALCSEILHEVQQYVKLQQSYRSDSHGLY